MLIKAIRIENNVFLEDTQLNFTLTLNQINESKLSKVGYRALDLATAFQNRLLVPHSFVIPDFYIEEFLTSSGIDIQIKKLIKDATQTNKLDNLQKDIRTLFEKASFSQEYENQLKEAYLALNINQTLEAAQDLLSDEEPIVNLIISPTYLQENDLLGLFLNIKGTKSFLNAIKSAVLSLYTVEQIQYRRKKQIKDFNVGIIVQRMIPSESTIRTNSEGTLGSFDISIKAYFGLLDLTKTTETDSFTVNFDSLKISNAKVIRQSYALKPAGDTAMLLKQALGSKGSEQKISDRQVEESARLTKKLKKTLECNFNAIFSSKKANIFLMYLNRKIGNEINDTKEEESISTLAKTDEIYEEHPKEEKSSDVEEVLNFQDDESDSAVRPTETADELINESQYGGLDDEENSVQFTEIDEQQVTVQPADLQSEDVGEQVAVEDSLASVDDVPTMSNELAQQIASEEKSVEETATVHREQEFNEEEVAEKEAEQQVGEQVGEQEIGELPVDNSERSADIGENEADEQVGEQILDSQPADVSSQSADSQYTQVDSQNDDFIVPETNINSDSTLEKNQSIQEFDEETNFYLEMVRELEGELDAKIQSMYRSRYGDEPISIEDAFARLSSDGSVQSLDSVRAFKELRETLESGGEPDLNSFNEITGDVKKFIYD